MDELDLRALRRLTTDGRVTWSDLAQHLRLSAPSSAERVRRLEERGVIKHYGAVLDREALGYAFMALVGVDLSHPRHRAEFLKIIADRPEIVECHHVTGDHDYVLKIVCRNAAHFDELINDGLKQGDAVARTRTMVVLSTPKDILFSPMGEIAP